MISSDDPVRVFQQFATLDLLSRGRAEIMAGRGSFIESFPLFGYDLRDYDTLFAEHLELLLRIRDQEVVTWGAATGAPIEERGVYPAPAAAPDPGLGRGRRHARERGARRDAGAADGARDHRRAPERFVPFADLFRRTARAAGHIPPRRCRSTATATSPTRRAGPPTRPTRPSPR